MRKLHWYTEVILQETNDLKTVYFHVSCSRDLTRFDDVPEIRTAVIRFFVESGFIKHSEIPVKTSPVEMTDDIIRWIANAFQDEILQKMVESNNTLIPPSKKRQIYRNFMKENNTIELLQYYKKLFARAEHYYGIRIIQLILYKP